MPTPWSPSSTSRKQKSDAAPPEQGARAGAGAKSRVQEQGARAGQDRNRTGRNKAGTRQEQGRNNTRTNRTAATNVTAVSFSPTLRRCCCRRRVVCDGGLRACGDASCRPIRPDRPTSQPQTTRIQPPTEPHRTVIRLHSAVPNRQPGRPPSMNLRTGGLLCDDHRDHRRCCRRCRCRCRRSRHCHPCRGGANASSARDCTPAHRPTPRAADSS